MNGVKARIWCIPFVLVALVGSACGAAGGDTGDSTATVSERQRGATDAQAPKASGTADPESIRTDFGADASTIRVGILADLSGPFSTIVKDIVAAQQVYWDKLNAEGGIAGRRVELVIEDTRYDIPAHKQKFQAMGATDADGVLILSQSTGSPHTAAIRTELEAADMIAIPLSFYSGWADPAFGRNVFETYTNFCFESINSLQYLHDEVGTKRVAIVSFPGEYGQDGARGAKLAAEGLGLDVVFDGEAKVTPPSATNPNPDNSGIVTSIIDSSPDLVWAAVNPATLAVLMGQAAAKGYRGQWSGNAPSYHESLLKSDVKGLIDSSFHLPSFTVPVGADVPGMAPMIDAVTAAKPDMRPSDFLVMGWTEAQITTAILRQAAASGDLTRAGVKRAAFALEKVDFGGLAPAQSWKGDPDDYMVRQSYMFKPKLSLYREGPLGTGHTGNELVKGPFSSPITDDYDYATRGACFKPAG